MPEQNSVAMAKFFETPKPKKFHIEPRYWDPKKEEREARQRRINEELGIVNEGEFKPHITKGEFRRGFSKGRWPHDRQRKRSNTRLLILIILIAALFYFILK